MSGGGEKRVGAAGPPGAPFRRLLLDCLALIDAARSCGSGDDPGGQGRRLDHLFARLAQKDEAQAGPVQELIWSLWCDHADVRLAARMRQAGEALASGRHAEATTILDSLVTEAPDWAEAWNKRATLFYILGRDAESLRDIAATLRLEPRHFGAIAGFGQIALRNGELALALAAFEAALSINPHLDGLVEAVAALELSLSAGAGRAN